ncbi:hypothetical protein COCON_G00159020 [Conger conger]|uniref:Uncharacterized protein n=1 Tax=Conger conger TaxID=82655 RepID=A0A9Q1D9X7_CONCO|nr:hypothetical protein COCON_G00159020 [Conger conger]
MRSPPPAGEVTLAGKRGERWRGLNKFDEKEVSTVFSGGAEPRHQPRMKPRPLDFGGMDEGSSGRTDVWTDRGETTPSVTFTACLHRGQICIHNQPQEPQKKEDFTWSRMLTLKRKWRCRMLNRLPGGEALKMAAVVYYGVA